MTRRNQSNAHGLSLRMRAHCTADKPFPHKSVRTRTRAPSCLHTNFTTSPRSRIQRYQYPVAVQRSNLGGSGVRAANQGAPSTIRSAGLLTCAVHIRSTYSDPSVRYNIGPPLCASYRTLNTTIVPSTRPCPRLIPMLLPFPTFNPSSMPPWTRMRRKQKATYSLIPLPPRYSPATRPPPFCLSFKSWSSDLIVIAGAIRD